MSYLISNNLVPSLSERYLLSHAINFIPTMHRKKKNANAKIKKSERVDI